jgi:outer membrane protein assembly factor BamB
VALIELSPEHPAPPEAAAPPPAYYYRRAGFVLAVLLVLTLGGAAPVHSVLFARIGSVPVPDGGDYQLVNGILYTMDLGGDPRVLTAWQPAPVRRLWSHTAAAGGEPFYVTAATADITVLRSGNGVTVLDARTGAVRWVPPVGVVPVSDRTGYVEREIFRPGTEYDADSGDPGELYGTMNGVLHTEPAVRTELQGVDLLTGAKVWSLAYPGSVFTTLARSTLDTIVVLTADKLLVVDSATGAVLRQRPIPRIGGVTATEGEVAGDTVLVHYGVFGMGGQVVAYGLGDLEERWRQVQPDPAGNSAFCSGLICSPSGDELSVLDPATGAERWRVGDNTDVLAAGPGTVLQAQGRLRPLRITDAVTGRTRLELGSWNYYFAGQDDDSFVLSRANPRHTTEFGLLRPGATAVQPIGVLPGIAGQCAPNPGLLACRVGDDVELWTIPS